MDGAGVAEAGNDLEAWNRALADELLDGRFEAQPLYLFVEPERLKALSVVIGANLETVFSASLGWRSGVSLFNPQLQAAARWERAGKRGPPPYLAALVSLTSAAAAMVADHNFSATNYRDRLCGFLGATGGSIIVSPVCGRAEIERADPSGESEHRQQTRDRQALAEFLLNETIVVGDHAINLRYQGPAQISDEVANLLLGERGVWREPSDDGLDLATGGEPSGHGPPKIGRPFRRFAEGAVRAVARPGRSLSLWKREEGPPEDLGRSDAAHDLEPCQIEIGLRRPIARHPLRVVEVVVVVGSVPTQRHRVGK